MLAGPDWIGRHLPDLYVHAPLHMNQQSSHLGGAGAVGGVGRHEGMQQLLRRRRQARQQRQPPLAQVLVLAPACVQGVAVKIYTDDERKKCTSVIIHR